MKKILLTSTAMGLFAAGSAFAAGPVVTLGGSADFQIGNGSQETFFQTQAGPGGADTSVFSRELHTRADTRLNVKVDGKADNGLGYGAYIELNADTAQNDSSAGDTAAEKTYLYVETGFGRVEAGATGDAADALRVDASTFARATGGIGGDFYRYVDLSTNVAATADNYMILPGLPTAVGLPGEANYGMVAGATEPDTHNDRATANKVSYYSPRIQGAQFGLSYTPDQSERGTSSGFGVGNTAGTAGVFENVFNAGLNYQGQFNDNFGIAASLTGEWGNTKDDVVAPISAYDDLEAYAAGVSVSYAGFTVGGSYGDAPEVGQLASVGTEVSYWTLGAAYEFGPFGTSVTYMDSSVKNPSLAAPDKDFTNLSLGADYQLAPGLVPYVEVSFFETDDNVAATPDNEGTVFILGTELNF